MKKQVLLTIGGIFILLSFLAIALFLIVTAPQESIDGDISLVGEWKVYEYENKAVDNETLVFDENIVTDYRNGETEPFYEVGYSIEDLTLKLKDLNKEFYIKKVSDNNIVLAETKEKLLKIFKISDEILAKKDIVGSWDVVMHAGTPVENEKVEFSDNIIKDFRDGSDKPYLESSYEWENEKTIFVEAMNISFEIHKLSEDYLILLEKGNQYVWELKKSN